MKLIRIYAMFLAAGLLALAPSRAQAQAKPLTITLTATYQAAAPNPTGPDQNIQASVTKSVKFTSASILNLIATNMGFSPHGYTLIYDPIADQLGATNKVTDDFEDASSILSIDNSGTSVSSGSSNSDTGQNKQSMTSYVVMTFDDGKGNSFTVDGLFKVSVSQPAPTASQTANSITPNETISFSGSVAGFGTVVDSSGNTDDAVFSGSVSGGGSGQGSSPAPAFPRRNMRPKVLLSALLLGGIMVGFAIWLAGPSRPPASPLPVAEALPLATQTVVSLIKTNPPRPKVPPSVVRTNETPPTDGSDSGNAILADLEKPDREARQSALQRARDLDDRSIIPRLREISSRTDDPREKADIQDTIDFLNLPDISENMAAAHAARAAAGLPDPPQSPTNRWTGQPFHPQQQ